MPPYGSNGPGGMSYTERRTSNQLQNECATIATNNFSIVSKLSVEKLYLQHRGPSLLEPFAKYKRRAPLINRGYWLRMRAIESTVDDFIVSSTAKHKVVVNLGCGYDPLPFHYLAQSSLKDLLFIDVDYRDLLQRKLTVLLQDQRFTSKLPQIFQDYSAIQSPILFQSETYCAIGLDLADSDGLVGALRTQGLLPDGFAILFLAEVSITYMTLQSANRLLRQLVRSFENAHICVLEQFLPDGLDHPFAATMLAHFAKQQAHIQSVMKYHSLQDHENRFREAGWLHVHAQSLWDFWNKLSDRDASELLALDSFEPFDEWEEFILFASHYFVLIADNKLGCVLSGSVGAVGAIFSSGPEMKSNPCSWSLGIQHMRSSPSSPRSFGQAVNLSDDALVIFGGLNCKHSSTAYSSSGQTLDLNLAAFPTSLRCGHTITEVGAGKFLVVGGRTSPSRATGDCYLFVAGSKEWSPVESIKPARYRHGAVSIFDGHAHRVLVFGGRTSCGKILDDCQIWGPESGWTVMNMCGDTLPACFGHAMLSLTGSTGIIMGGLSQTLKFMEEEFQWTVAFAGDLPRLHVSKTDKGPYHSHPFRVRFGATLLQGPVLVGGIASQPIPRSQEALLLNHTKDIPVNMFEMINPRPLLIGTTLVNIGDDVVIMVGGGGVCFSFGSYMNLNWSRIVLPRQLLRILGHKQRHPDVDMPPLAGGQIAVGKAEPVSPTVLEIQCNNTKGLYEVVDTAREPCVVRDIKPGSCIQLWNLDYLVSKIGHETKLSVHVGQDRYLKYLPEKNFKYCVESFEEFKRQLLLNEHVYLRSLAASTPFRKTANIVKDFPSIAPDFEIPTLLQNLFDLEHKLHSSVLRISGDVAIWLHYDVMSNFLFQIRGYKRVVLFHPTDAMALGLPAGMTVSSQNTSLWQGDAAITNSMPRGTVVTLGPGDVLYIPRFWLHATYPSTGGVEHEPSIAINIFWRDLADRDYAIGRDVYGSRDLAIYEHGRECLNRIRRAISDSTNSTTEDQKEQCRAIRKQLAQYLAGAEKSLVQDSNVKAWTEAGALHKKFSKAPKDVRDFYLPRLIEELVKE